MSEDSANYVPTLKRSARYAARALISAPIEILTDDENFSIFHYSWDANVAMPHRYEI
jgi:hypothetical protein